eukprot:09105.XXX_137152_137388_1 [CDS] Oithona nana genome sequencing.
MTKYKCKFFHTISSSISSGIEGSILTIDCIVSCLKVNSSLSVGTKGGRFIIFSPIGFKGGGPRLIGFGSGAMAAAAAI